MPKYYVQSGRVQLVLEAQNAHEAAVRAFQWTCDKQAEIRTASPLDHVQEAERNGWQLHDVIYVHEQGFGGPGGVLFDTLDIVAAWQGDSFPWLN